MDEPTVSGTRIVRLLAIARGLEDEGNYNVAKLYRAAAAGEGARAGREHPTLSGDLLPAMQLAIDDLRAAGRGGALLDAMQVSLGHVRDRAWTTLADAPNPRVCRDCGEVLLTSDAAPRCPACGAWPLTLESFGPIYYLEPLPREDVLRVLGENLADVERLAAGVSDTQAGHGRWPMRAMLEHLLGAEQLLAGRAERMLAEDDPLLVSVDAATISVAAEPGTAAPPDTFAGLLAAFGATRRATIARYTALAPGDWQRTGYHPEWGRMSVLQQIGYLARHEQAHLAEFEARRNGR